MSWWQQPFFQVALPIIITFAIATWYQNSRITDLRDSIGRRIDDSNKRIDNLGDSLSKRIDDLRDAINKRFDAIEKRLSSIEDLLRDHDRRITTLEERTSPIRR
ncbi:MAG: hypothetical protein LAQ69_05770 [Acidobacteriia bacterium]|nr:hypothetical protein [Terriglobia bacterium]